LTIDSNHLFQALGLGSKFSELNVIHGDGFTPDWPAKALPGHP